MSPLMTAHLRFALQRHGWPALAGVLMLLLIWPLAHWGTDQAIEEAATLRTAQAAQRLQQAKPPETNNTQADRSAAFQARLPGAAGALDAVRLIHSAALARGVTLAAGEYRLVREGSSTPVQRYQITLPASGSYLAVRGWMADVMNALPTVAMEELSLVRQSVGSPTLEARVRWTLYLQVP